MARVQAGRSRRGGGGVPRTRAPLRNGAGDGGRLTDFAAVVHSFGGPVLFVLAWLQGETAVILGGSLAAQGYWPWWAVWILATIPAITGHQIYHAVGRRIGVRALERLPRRFAPAVTRARAALLANDARVMLAMRFAYGIRLPLPILCGASGVTPARFFRYNVATGLAWALLFTGVGYATGAAAATAFRNIEHVATWALLASIAVAAATPLVLERIAPGRGVEP